MSDPAFARSAAWSRVRGRGMIGIRADLAEAGPAIAEACAVPIPAARRLTTEGDRSLAWMSPDELLLFLPAGETTETLAALSNALGARHHLAVDLSDARAIFEISGDGAREVLAKGAPVDLSRGAFTLGDVRRTRLGQLAAAFALVGEGPDRFHLVCFRSVAAHVERWLDVAARAGSLPGVL